MVKSWAGHGQVKTWSECVYLHVPDLVRVAVISRLADIPRDIPRPAVPLAVPGRVLSPRSATGPGRAGLLCGDGMLPCPRRLDGYEGDGRAGLLCAVLALLPLPGLSLPRLPCNESYKKEFNDKLK